MSEDELVYECRSCLGYYPAAEMEAGRCQDCHDEWVADFVPEWDEEEYEAFGIAVERDR